jgi:hypothetical protein
MRFTTRLGGSPDSRKSIKRSVCDMLPVLGGDDG